VNVGTITTWEKNRQEPRGGHLAGHRGEPPLEDPTDARVGAADLTPLPGRDGRRIKPEPAGQLPFGETLILAGALQASAKALGLRAGS
jgi:hypothetical protein